MTYTQQTLFAINSYHNSLGETDQRKLAVSEKIAKAQEDKILTFMRENQRKEGWSSWELHSEHFPHMLETSVRRALTNISYDLHNPNGTVYRTRARRMGGHGSTVSVWQYKSFAK